MRETLGFLRDLRACNDRVWFDENRTRWERVRERMRTFAEGLIDGISSFDSSVRGLRPADCTYRIARDTRFSPDKSPYKTYVGIYVAPLGKKSGYAGYYFHIEPDGGGLLGGSLLAAGLYRPEAVVLRSVRDEILDHGAELAAAVREAKDFGLDAGNPLRRTPSGYPRGTEYDDWLRMREFLLERPLTEEELLAPDLLERTVEAFRRTNRFVGQLNRAVRFAYEEMM